MVTISGRVRSMQAEVKLEVVVEYSQISVGTHSTWSVLNVKSQRSTENSLVRFEKNAIATDVN